MRQRPSADALEDFEGPLDLILYLLSKNKIEIQDIPIALILDQYLEYLDRRQQLDLEVASEFVAMAAHLMYIKTRMLLSLEDEEAQSEMDLLIKSLEERRNNDTYQRIKGVIDRMSAMSEFGRDIMTKNPEPVERGKVFLYHHKPEDLLEAFQSIQERSERAAPPSVSAFEEIVRREPYPVADKAKEILGDDGQHLQGQAGEADRRGERLHHQSSVLRFRYSAPVRCVKPNDDRSKRNGIRRGGDPLRRRRAGGHQEDLYGLGCGPLRCGAGAPAPGGLLRL